MERYRTKVGPPWRIPLASAPRFGDFGCVPGSSVKLRAPSKVHQARSRVPELRRGDLAGLSSYTREGFAQDLRQTVSHLQSREIRVVFVGDFPSQPAVNSRNLRLVSRWPWLAPHPTLPEAHRAQNAKVHQALEGLPRSEDFVVLDPAPEILGWQSLTRDAAPLYIDSHHLSDEGAVLLKSLLEPVFRQMQDWR